MTGTNARQRGRLESSRGAQIAPKRSAFAANRVERRQLARREEPQQFRDVQSQGRVLIRVSATALKRFDSRRLH